jgi:hypothetical protein
LAGFFEYGDESSGSGATELVSWRLSVSESDDAIVVLMAESGQVCVCLQSDGRFCVIAFIKNMAPIAFRIFVSLVPLFINRCYTFRTLNSTFRRNAAIHVLPTAKHKRFISTDFDGSCNIGYNHSTVS